MTASMVTSPILICFMFAPFFGSDCRQSRSAPQARRFLAGARDIFGVAAAILVDALGRQLQHAVGERGEKMPVVRDEQHGALEFARAH